MEEYSPMVIESSEDKEEITQVLNANDYYNSSDVCEYTLPVQESEPLNYNIVNGDTTDKYIEVSYCLW